MSGIFSVFLSLLVLTLCVFDSWMRFCLSDVKRSNSSNKKSCHASRRSTPRDYATYARSTKTRYAEAITVTFNYPRSIIFIVHIPGVVTNITYALLNVFYKVYMYFSEKYYINCYIPCHFSRTDIILFSCQHVKLFSSFLYQDSLNICLCKVQF